MHNAPDLLPVLYQTEQMQGWSAGMRAITLALLDHPATALGPILELGCGAGDLLAALANRHPTKPVFGADINPLALSYASRLLMRPPTLATADLQRLPFADASFGLVLALDAIDQKGVEPVAALCESWRVLQPQGCLLLRVSAHPWLESAHDAAFNTGRRFASAELTGMLRAVGFRPIRTTYANTLLAPAIVLMRLLQRWRVLPFHQDHYTAPMINRVLALSLQLEAHWLQTHNLEFGVSLCVLAQKSAPGPLFQQEQSHANQCPRLHSLADLQ
ncbi:MAG: class I SAM-dependent methyltransferase [Caldilineaceae bacterium]